METKESLLRDDETLQFALGQALGEELAEYFEKGVVYTMVHAIAANPDMEFVRASEANPWAMDRDGLIFVGIGGAFRIFDASGNLLA